MKMAALLAKAFLSAISYDKVGLVMKFTLRNVCVCVHRQLRCACVHVCACARPYVFERTAGDHEHIRMFIKNFVMLSM